MAAFSDEAAMMLDERARVIQLYFLQAGASVVLFFFQAEDGIRDLTVTGVQTCALPICTALVPVRSRGRVWPCTGKRGSGPGRLPLWRGGRSPPGASWRQSARGPAVASTDRKSVG